jgi:hypothetical protein
MVTGRANLLKQGKVHMNVEGLGLKAGEAVGDDLEPFTDSVEMFEPLLQAEVAQVVGDELIAQEAGELLILLCVQQRLACSVGINPPGKKSEPRSLNSRKEGNQISEAY